MTNRADVIRAANHWAAEMEKAVEAVSEAGAHVEIVDGNRAIADTLRQCASLLALDEAPVVKPTDTVANEAKRLLRLIEMASAKDLHAAFCNGVHAPDGQCEGEYWLSETTEALRAALAGGEGR